LTFGGASEARAPKPKKKVVVYHCDQGESENPHVRRPGSQARGGLYQYGGASATKALHPKEASKNSQNSTGDRSTKLSVSSCR